MTAHRHQDWLWVAVWALAVLTIFRFAWAIVRSVVAT